MRTILLIILCALLSGSVRAADPISALWIGNDLHISLAEPGCLYLADVNTYTHLPDSCDVLEYIAPASGGDQFYSPVGKVIVQITNAGQVEHRLTTPINYRYATAFPLMVGP